MSQRKSAFDREKAAVVCQKYKCDLSFLVNTHVLKKTDKTKN